MGQIAASDRGDDGSNGAIEENGVLIELDERAVQAVDDAVINEANEQQLAVGSKLA